MTTTTLTVNHGGDQNDDHDDDGSGDRGRGDANIVNKNKDNNNNNNVNVWIGGSSCLAHTFFVNYHRFITGGGEEEDEEPNRILIPLLSKKWIVTGVEEQPPDWMNEFMIKDEDVTTTTTTAQNNNNNNNKKNNNSNSSNSSLPPPIVIVKYLKLDLTTVTSTNVAKDFVTQQLGHDMIIDNIVVGIRPKLFDTYIFTSTPRKMVHGLQRILQEMMVVPKRRVPFILNISSVAAVDHLTTQRNVVEEDDDDDGYGYGYWKSKNNNGGQADSTTMMTMDDANLLLPPISTYKAPYDRFKRMTEDMITNLFRKNIPSNYCHLRISALFSDDIKCIQCNALGLQCYVGTNMPFPIDCNSSLNVANAIYLILQVAHYNNNNRINHHRSNTNNNTTNNRHKSSIIPIPISRIYYYTRPLELHEDPVPYGYYLQQYRTAYGIGNNNNNNRNNNNTVPSSPSSSQRQRRQWWWSWPWSLSSINIFPIHIPVWFVLTMVQLVQWLALMNRWSVSFYRYTISSSISSISSSSSPISSDEENEDDNLLWKGIPYLDSIDYLLQVSVREHSFNCNRFRDFVQMVVEERSTNNPSWRNNKIFYFEEETILECFQRRRQYLEENPNHQSEKRNE